MKTIIAGSRGLGYRDLLFALAACPWASEISSVVTGGARGIDTAGAAWAGTKRIPVEIYPAKWQKGGRYNPRAGYERNRTMAALPGVAALLAVWDGVSRGTADMIQIALAQGLRVYVHTRADGWAPEAPPDRTGL